MAHKRRRISFLTISVFAFFLVCGVVAVLTTLHVFGQTDIQALHRFPRIASLRAKLSPALPAAAETLKVAVPVSARPIGTYSRVVRDDLWSLEHQRIAVVYLPEAQVSEEMLTNLKSILGRVLKHEKRKGYVFTEADFFPKGTRQGLTAGIPPGKRALRLEANQVRGLAGLNRGDRFDLVATQAVELSDVDRMKFGGEFYSKQIALDMQARNLKKQASVKVIVQNGLVVEPMATRSVPVYSRGLTQSRVMTRPVQDVVIAVDPEEVAAVTQSVAIGSDLQCVPRSGHPEDDVASQTPGAEPINPFPSTVDRLGGSEDDRPTEQRRGLRIVESIVGSERTMRPVPGLASPVSARQGGAERGTGPEPITVPTSGEAIEPESFDANEEESAETSPTTKTPDTR